MDRHGNVGARLSTRAVALLVQRCLGSRPAWQRPASRDTSFMRQTRHRSTSVVRRYICDGELFRRNLVIEVGL
jgi:hypothetical protein